MNKINLFIGASLFTVNTFAQQGPTTNSPATPGLNGTNARDFWSRAGNSGVGANNSNNIFGTLWDSPVYHFTSGQNRMALWGNTGSPSAPFGGGLSINLTPANPILVPKSLLTIGEDADGIGEANSGWRAWMKVGTFNQGGSDLAYFGLKNEGSGDRNDAVIAWGDDRGLINSPNQFAPDYFRFIFTSDYGTGTDLPNDPQGSNSLEIARLSPFGSMGIGNYYNHPLFPITKEPARRLEILSDKTTATGNGSPLIRLTHTQQNPNAVTSTGKFSEFEPRSNGNLFISVRDNTQINNTTRNLKERFVGINTNNAGNTLEINSQLVSSSTQNGFTGSTSANATGWSGLRFTDLKSSSIPQANGNGIDNTKVLSVDQNGDVVLVDGGGCKTTLVKTTAFTGNAYGCSNGGVMLEYGVDTNCNNILDANEVNGNLTQYVCNGTNGISGTNGTNGLNSLSSSTPFSGSLGGCANGGVKVEFGLDVSNDGILQTSEITQTQYVCNGLNGAPGPTGPAGGVVNAQNGLNLPNPQTIELGGTLIRSTQIDMIGSGTPYNIYFTGQSSNTNGTGLSLGRPFNQTLEGKLDVLNNHMRYAGYFRTTGATINPALAVTGAVQGDLIGANTGSQRFGTQGYCQTNVSGISYGVNGVADCNSSSVVSGLTNRGVQGRAIGQAELNQGGFFDAIQGATNIGMYAKAGIPGGPNYPTGVNIAVYGNAVTNPNFYAGYFDGNVIINGSGSMVNGASMTSDQQFKTNISNISNAANLINSLQPKYFYFDTTNVYGLNFDHKKQYGLIAQEVEQILPELIGQVSKPAVVDSMGNIVHPAITYKTLNYNSFIAILIKAYQEQQSKIDSLTSKLNSKDSIQDARLSALEDAINRCCTNNTSRNNTSTSLNQLDVELSDKDAVVLNQNVPNPFAEQTTITYNVPVNVGKAQLLFYNTEGKLIQTVDITTRGKGKINVFANDLSSGLYHYTLVVDGKVADSKKMVRE